MLTSRETGYFEVMDRVVPIIEAVRKDGDDALFRLTKEFDGVELDRLEVRDEEVEEAYERVDPGLVSALEAAAENIAAYHGEQADASLCLDEVKPGLFLGYKTAPLASAGAYIPGGTAVYPSTALMTVIPAKIAGVVEVIVCTPPGGDGKVNPLTLVAADMAGADRIFKVGGAHAIAAMAFGTESIPAVDKIVGPGGIFVTAAKLYLSNTISIDFPAGPSEIVVLADETGNPAWIASDMLAQIEHDPRSRAVLVTTSEELAEGVKRELEVQGGQLERREIIQASLENAAILLAERLDEGIVLSNKIAPEHLEILVRDPLSVLERIHHAGSISIGGYAPAAAGDYASGTNHVLPTGGYARTYSGLGVHHFTKKINLQVIDKFALKQLRETIVKLARAEGFEGHAASIEKRFQ